MRLLIPVLLVTLALTSCQTLTNSPRKPVVKPEFICAPTAYIPEDKRKVPPLVVNGTNEEKIKQFKVWSADNLIRYGSLNAGYSTLIECIIRYHPEVKSYLE